MIREDVTELILESKREKGLTFAAIADKLGKPKVWAAAALFGQHPMDAETAETVTKATAPLRSVLTAGELGQA